ncbi:MAG: oligosaccharide flippase family protein, partial [Clostridia bacterium]|nr:oligosaccharide flippase family protein [Clostridia bacterium]
MKTTKTKNKKQSFLEGAMTLMIAMALVKILGAVFKIPLGNMIGASGMGYFQTAYDLYLPVYAVALSGLPIAVCRMVASYMAQGNVRDSRTVLKVAQKTFLIMGIVGTVLLLLLSYPYLRVIGARNNDALLSLIVIAPAILFCCIISTYRGYYEGLCNMTPTAVSQVIESLGKVIIGIALVFVVKKMGFDESVQAAAAIFGIMLGTMFGALYLKLRYVKGGDGITNQMLLDCEAKAQTQKQILKSLLIIAVPVVIGSLASQIAGLVDAVTVQKRLNDMVSANPQLVETLFPEMWKSFLDDTSLSTVQAKYDA